MGNLEYQKRVEEHTATKVTIGTNLKEKSIIEWCSIWISQGVTPRVSCEDHKEDNEPHCPEIWISSGHPKKSWCQQNNLSRKINPAQCTSWSRRCDSKIRVNNLVELYKSMYESKIDP